MAEVQSQAPQPDQWWAAFPAPRAKVPEITADEVMKMFDDMDIKPEPRSFLLVDVRRTDWEVSLYLRILTLLLDL
jgi:arsenical-resistance protein 2